MSNEKRLVLCVLIIFGWVMIAPRLFQSLGMLPPPAKKAPPPPLAAADPLKNDKKPGDGNAELKSPASRAEAAAKSVATAAQTTPKAEDKAAKPAGEKPRSTSPAPVDYQDLILGSAHDKSPDGYRIEVQLAQKGAGVESILSSRYDAEFEGRTNPHLPLQIIRRDPIVRPPLSLTMNVDPVKNGDAGPRAENIEQDSGGDQPNLVPPPEDLLDSVLWEVVRDDNAQIVLPLTAEDPISGKSIKGQQVGFRTTASNGVVVTKTFRLWQTMDGVELELRFESPDRDRTFSYNLMGPHGIPIEGEWYTGTFREVFFGTYDQGKIKVDTQTAYDIAKARDKPIESTTLPLRFTGVENQYFATLMAPYPAPTGDDERLDRETEAIVLHEDPKALQKADVGVRMSSKPIKVGPNLPRVHTYRIFSGPKTEEALTPYGASALASYRKSSYIPGASYIARFVITPTLEFTYRVTRWVAGLFGSERGNWGIAIILLTLLVKLMMFPLGRKQALMAQRSQELQPYLKQIQEKYKDDKERQTKETFALYKKHGVNPVSGCIPALIQLPIFVGLWQALNTSVALRHASFLWINDLAAPDMLFRFPVEIMFLGHWFNLLPIVVVALMLFQTKLFAPPPTTPEAEMQQKTMKYMMVFMAFMFYKVPSGLGIYFITSSLWSIGERLLLPKITHATEKKTDDEIDTGKSGDGGPRGRGGPDGNGPAPPKKPPGAFSQFMEKILDEARKDPTYRKVIEQRDGKTKEGRPDSDDQRDRDRGKPRARPGRK
jgi:YidC/Oxa1 family membrane protein insertase